ncbi:MAG TPA: aminotransferase class V-fold PLP-dependent enzyme [Patescibacteria group bacterium]|nr:aminotransferase class V-fold PLP-dependent enzyme [Patescibacteria group bacterium]
MIYLDNAATSFPKPPAVAAEIVDFLERSAGNPGRSGHALAVAAQAVVAATRAQLAGLFGVPDPARVVFAANATDALNVALWGLLRPGDRVVTTSLEHNAVARPLHALAGRGVGVTRVACAPDGTLDLADLDRALRSGPVRLVAMCHASNVSGTILPAREAAQLAHEHGALFLLDAAQTAGVLPIDVREMGLDLLAFPGHKALLGPTGTGGLYVAPGVRLSPLRQGGTGTRSEEEEQPEELPEALEAGTLNTVGIAGLGAAVRYLRQQGQEAIRAHEVALTARLMDGLVRIPGLRIHGTGDPTRQVATVSLSLEGWEPVDVAAVLDSSFGIAVRSGLHCAPLAHRTLGTFPRGTVRLSPGCFSTDDDVDQALAALRKLAGSAA